MGRHERGRRGAESRRRLSPRHVRRPRLIRLLDGATGQAIVLAAPAGYGKTALAVEWLERKRFVWYTATHASADLVSFALGLVEALGAIVPGAGEHVEARVRIGEAPEESARPLAELVAADLAAWPDDAWLVVDDYHLVADSTAVEEFVDWLLTLAPVRLLVTSRRRPAWATARRVLYGEIFELGREELAMTAEEASLLVGGRPREGVERLVQHAGGWPAALGLAALSRSSSLPPERIADALFRYLADEVLRREPPDVQRFMLAASVPLGLDARVAREVVGDADGPSALERLAGEGLLQPGDRGVRFHPLLRDFLLHRLDEENPELGRSLYERAIADARRAGHLDDAFELAIECGRREVAAEILSGQVDELLDAGRVETIERRLKECGDAALGVPELVLAQAEVHVRRGRLFEAAALAEDLAGRLPAGHDRLSTAWFVAGRALHLLSEDERALRCHLRAVECASKLHDRANALWGAIVLAAQLEDPSLERLVAELEVVATQDLDARLQLGSGRVFLASRGTTLAGLARQLEPLLPLAARHADPMAHNTLLLAAAYLRVSGARYGPGREFADSAVALCETYRLGRMKRAFCLCYRAAADIGRRRLAQADRTLEEISGLGVDRTQVILAEQRNLRAKLRIARGEFRELLDEAADELGSAAPRGALGELAGLVALAAAGLGEHDLAEVEACRARTSTRSIEAWWYARWALVDAADVPALFEEAAAADMLDAFVHAYRARPELLALAAASAPLRTRLRELVVEADDGALAKEAGLPTPVRVRAGDGLALLTRRENDVLELMSQGLANREIARRLFISEKTVKVHATHIFEKLGVATRVQAALALRERLAPEP